MRTHRFRSTVVTGIAGLIMTGAAIAPAAAASAPAPADPTPIPAPAAPAPKPAPADPTPIAAPPAQVAAQQGKFPSEWSSPNGDWTISSRFDGHDVALQMGTWSHRGDIRVFITDPTGTRTSHDFRLDESAAMEGWYQFSDSWRAHYPDAGPGQYKVVFAMKTSKGWQNICDKTLGFVVR